jgi:hypothetical protein
VKKKCKSKKTREPESKADESRVESSMIPRKRALESRGEDSESESESEFERPTSMCLSCWCLFDMNIDVALLQNVSSSGSRSVRFVQSWR